MTKVSRRIALFALIVALPICGIWFFQKKLITFDGQTMGTTYSIKCYVPLWVNQERVRYTVDKELERLTTVFSSWSDESEISRFNLNDVTNPIEISEDFKNVLRIAYELYDLSSGSYDPTIKPLADLWGFNSVNSYFKEPKRKDVNALLPAIGLDKIVFQEYSLQKLDPAVSLDLSSIAKGYAVDRIAEIIQTHGSKRFMVEVGGEIRVLSPQKHYWQIGITHPEYTLNKQTVLMKLGLRTGAVATSGDYRNFFEKDNTIYSHIFDPKALAPVQNKVTSVTVYAPTCMLADGLATTLMVLGVERGLSLIEALDGVECMILKRDGDKLLPYYSSHFQDYISDNSFFESYSIRRVIAD